jgi:hypothetical protein
MFTETAILDEPIVTPFDEPIAATRTPTVAEKSPRWPWIMAAVAFLEFVLAGWWMYKVLNFAEGDALARTRAAKTILFSRDPHLGAMGFYWMPLPMLIRLPFVSVLQLVGYAWLAGPASTAMCAALTIPVLAAIGRQVGASTAITVAVCAVYALSPVTIYMAADGMSEACFGLFIALSILAYLRWCQSHQVWDLVFLAAACAGGIATRYEMLVLAPVLVIAAALQLPRARWMSTIVLALIPTGFVFGAWLLASKLIVNDAFFFYGPTAALTKTPEGAVWLPPHPSLLGSALFTSGRVLIFAPAILLICFGRREHWKMRLGLLAAAACVPAFVALQLYQRSTWAVPRFFTNHVVFGAAMAMLVMSAKSDPDGGMDGAVRVSRNWKMPALGVTVVLLQVAGAIAGTFFLADPKVSAAESEWVFFRGVLGRDDSTLPTVGGQQLDRSQSDLHPYQELTAELDKLLVHGKRVAMDTLVGVPVLLTSKPEQFIIPEDRDFQLIMADPVGRVDFIVLLPSSRASYGADLVANAVRQPDSRGTWKQQRQFGNGIAFLYEWIPATAKPSGSTPPTTGLPTNPSTTTPPAPKPAIVSP